MLKRMVSGIMLTLLLIGMWTLAFNVQRIECSEPLEKEWSRTYGETLQDNAYSVVQTNDRGYAIAGYTGPFNGPCDFWLVKTNSTGHMEWNQTYHNDRIDRACTLIQTDDGGYAMAGVTGPGSFNRDFWFVKTDANGTMQWNKIIGHEEGGNDYPYSLIQTDDGGYTMAGTKTDSFGRGDLWLVKTNRTGHVQWTLTYGGRFTDMAYSVLQTGDGGYAMAGLTESFSAGNGDFWLIKTNSTGHMQWNQTYGGTSLEDAHSMVQTDDGGYALAGDTWSFGAGQADFWLVKTNRTGDMEWNQTYGGTAVDQAYSMVKTGDGGYAVAGFTVSFGAGGYDSWLVKTNSTGHMQWNQTYGGANYDRTMSIVETGDGGYTLAGYTESFGAGNGDFWLIKLATEQISATIHIDPDTLNLKSNGQWITAYITLPEGYSVEDIIPETVNMADIPLVWSEIQNGVFMAKFDRAAVQGLTNEPDYEEGTKFSELTLTVRGKLIDGTPFEGTDTIRVIMK